MPSAKMAALLISSLMLSGCDGALDGYSTSTSQEAYPAGGYYGGPAGPAPGYYAAPAYPGPGYYPPPVPQSAYVTPYTYEPGWSGPGRGDWHDHDRRDHDWHDHGGPAYENGGGQPRQDYRQPPQMTQPRMAPPPPAASPPPAITRPQADQNRKLMDQLGFRPSH